MAYAVYLVHKRTYTSHIRDIIVQYIILPACKRREKSNKRTIRVEKHEGIYYIIIFYTYRYKPNLSEPAAMTALYMPYRCNIIALRRVGTGGTQKKN